MQGWPYFKINPSSITSYIFKHKINNKPIKIIYISKAGDDLLTQYKALKKSLSLTPHKNAVILFYSGVNDYIEPVKNEQLYFNIWKTLRYATSSALLVDIFFAPSNQSISETPTLKNFHANSAAKYKYNLTKTIKLANDYNIPIVLSTIAYNYCGYNHLDLYNSGDFKNQLFTLLEKLKEVDSLISPQKAINILNNILLAIADFKKNLPFEDFYDLTPKTAKYLTNALKAEKDKKYQEAIKDYKECLLFNKITDGDVIEHNHFITGIHFKIGKCFEKLKNYEKALYHYKKSQPDNCMQDKPSPKLNEIIKNTALKYKIPLIDTKTIITINAPHGLSNYTMFADTVHPNINTYKLIAFAFAEKIANITKQPLVNKDISTADLIREFNFTRADLAEMYISQLTWFVEFIYNDDNLETFNWYCTRFKNYLSDSKKPVEQYLF